MPFEILHFRGSDKILKDKKMVSDVKATMKYTDDVLCGSLYKRELFRQALDEMDWRRNGTLNILDGRRYQYKGFKNRVAIEGNFSAYEYILEGLLRLQIGYDKKLLDTGILLLTSKRSEKSPLGNSSDLAKSEVEKLYPTISLPVSIVLFDLQEPNEFKEEERGNDGKTNTM
jgi:lipoprotein NlpI